MLTSSTYPPPPPPHLNIAQKAWREGKKAFNKIAVRLKAPYVPQNYQRKLRQLSASNEKIKVAFLVSQSAKWNGNSLYRKLEEDARFSPLVVFAPSNADGSTASNDERECRFFRERGYHVVVIGSNAEFQSLKPDVVFYQQPWTLADMNLLPTEVSRYALCCYFPYAIVTSIENQHTWKTCRLFWQTLFCHFVFSTAVAEQLNARGIHNLFASGHPKLDAYLEPVKTNPWKDKEKFKIIYAPHHSFTADRACWATFGWNGRELLEWAKTHSDTEWIFKPHPRFRYAVIRQKEIMSASELDRYYDEWSKIGSVYTLGDYFDIFRTADLLITDCGSFLTEWLPTEKPCIHLISPNELPNCRSFVHEKSSRHYYKVKNLADLNAAVEMLAVRREDPMAAARIEDAKEIPLDNAKNIHQWLIDTIIERTK